MKTMKTIILWNEKRIVVRRFDDPQNLNGGNERVFLLRKLVHGHDPRWTDDPRWQVIDGQPEVDAEDQKDDP